MKIERKNRNAPTVMIVGDSIALGISSIIKQCNLFGEEELAWINSIAKGDKEKNKDADWAYDSVYISDWIHTNHMMSDIIPDVSKARGKLDVVLLNFAVLHNLQLGNHTINPMNVFM